MAASIAAIASGLLLLYFFLFFYFRDVDTQNLRNLLSSLLILPSSRSDPCRDILSRRYSPHDREEQKPSDRAVVEGLKDMLSLEVQRPTYIIMDVGGVSGKPGVLDEIYEGILREIRKSNQGDVRHFFRHFVVINHQGADVDGRGKDGDTPLHRETLKGRPRRWTTSLPDRGTNINARRCADTTPHRVCSNATRTRGSARCPV
jgi:hypothetical protein